jgi:hypothetical protein
VVALGLIFELPELRYELKSIARENLSCLRYRVVLIEKRVHLAKVIAFVGWMLIVGGVVGEWYTGNRVNDLDARIQGCSTARLTEVTAEAGEAKDSAASAKVSEDALEKKAAALKDRLEKASEKLGEIEEATLAQGPRWRLLERGEDVFIKALKPFAAQRVTVVSCGIGDTERYALEQALLNIFPKAGWTSPGYSAWAGCPFSLSGGNQIYFVAATDDSVEWAGMPAQQWAKVMCGKFNISHDAVNTLCDVLYKLRIYTTAFREKPLPEDIGTRNARSFFGFDASDGPAELAYKDPGRIFLLIGPNTPMFIDRSKHAQKNAKNK